MKKIWAIIESSPEFIDITPPSTRAQTSGPFNACGPDRPKLIDRAENGLRDDIVKYDLSNIVPGSDYFDSDHFTWNGIIFVSERMRQVMALDPAEVRYIDVDTSRSPPVLGVLNYQIMQCRQSLDVTAPPTDEEIDRSLAASAAAEAANLPLPSGGVTIREDITPPYDLFYESTVRCLMCSDAFALRVLRSTCTGMSFADPGHMYGSNIRFRTLRGIEEELGWDEKTRQTTVRLVEVAD